MYKRVKQLRQEHHLTQKAVSKSLHISISTYANYETGKVPIRALTIVQLADLYNTSTDYLMGRTDDPVPHKNTQPKKDA